MKSCSYICVLSKIMLAKLFLFNQLNQDYDGLIISFEPKLFVFPIIRFSNPIQEMGSCISKQPSIEPPDNLHDELTIGQKLSPLSEFFFEKFVIISLLQKKLQNISFDDNSLREMIQIVLELLVKMSSISISPQKPQVEQLFTKQIINSIKNQSVFLQDAIQIYKKSTATNSSNKVEDQLHIYHKIANIKRGLTYKTSPSIWNFQKKGKYFLQSQFDDEQQIQNGFKVMTGNKYKLLEQKQADEAILLQLFGQNISNSLEQLRFKYDSIANQSQQIGLLISKIFQKYSNQLKILKYTLKPQQVLVVAEISRDACNYHENGVYFLLIYFVVASKTYQQNGKSVGEIEKMLKQAVVLISLRYPPGKGLQQSQLHLTGRLKSIQLGKNHPQFKDFNFKTYKLEENGSKSVQLLKIILENAKIAQKNRIIFDEIIKKVCLKRCLSYKTGLKYDPNKPNEKAIIRIQQKMLFKSRSNKNDIQTNSSSIQNQLQLQQDNYKKQIQMILKQMKSISFKISDMLRGKCTFLNVQDILQTISDLRTYVQEYNKTSENLLRIIEIQSRFTKSIPISDVTLKIGINEEIVTELQLTVQNNMAAYFFAHKVYQLQRSEVFSKVKIVHNYYHQYKRDFSQLLIRRIMIAEKNNEGEICVNKDVIQKYFHLQNQKIGLYKTIFQDCLLKNGKIDKIKYESRCFQSNFQDFFRVIFTIKMKQWTKSFGLKMMNTLKRNHSIIKNDFCLYFFLLNCDIIEERPKIIQCILQNKAQVQHYQFTISLLEYYLKHQYGIDYFNLKEKQHLSKLYFLTENYDRIVSYFAQKCFKSNFNESLNQYEQKYHFEYFLNVIEGTHSCQTIDHLFDYSKLKFSQLQFDTISTNIIGLIQKMPQKKIQLSRVYYGIKLLKAESYLTQNREEQAIKILSELQQIYKERHDYQKTIICGFMLVQAKFRKQQTKQYLNHYVQMNRKAETLGVPLVGREIGQFQLRMAQTCFDLAETNNDLQIQLQGLNIHMKKAMEQFWGCKDIADIYFLYSYYQQKFEENNFSIPFKPNIMIKNAALTWKRLKEKGCQFLSQIKWPNLQRLALMANDISDKGCKHLAEANWPQLTYLNLQENEIIVDGCMSLSTANWPNLQQINLNLNTIQNEGCKYLSKSKWHKLIRIQLKNNQIQDEGCEYLSKANWPKLQSINLKDNRVSQKGCSFLIKSNWNLKKIDLCWNNIGNQGCKFLSLSNWTNLTQIYLRNNKIQAQGIKYLIAANWPNLTQLYLSENKLKKQGCTELRCSQWLQLSNLDLANCQIDAVGCEELIKANWSNLTELDLSSNQFGKDGCSIIIKSSWPKLSCLQLNDNQLGFQGCQILAQKQWPSLSLISIRENKVEVAVEEVHKLFKNQDLKILM